MFIGLLSVLNNPLCQARLTLLHTDFNESVFYPFTVSVNKYGESYILLMIHLLKHVFQIK